jgi:hypothetical protein
MTKLSIAKDHAGRPLADEWLCSPCFEARRNFEKSATEEHDAIMAQLQSMISQAAGKQ